MKLRLSDAIAFAAALAAAALALSAAKADDLGFPLAYHCEDGTRVTINPETENATIWLKGDRTLMLPARYAQGHSWFWQVEPQEEDCTAACVELSLRGPPTAYVTVEGASTKCVVLTLE